MSIPAGPDRLPTPLERLAEIPEEEIWLAKAKEQAHAARLPARRPAFMRTMSITKPEELRQADHKAVIAWEQFMREAEQAAPSTIRRRLSALSSLYKHLVRHGQASKNPVTEVERPVINRTEGSTLAFSKAQARKILDAPSIEMPEGEPLQGRALISGLRDRAILSVGLQVGLRRAEIAQRKGGRRDALAINLQTAARIRAYLGTAGHAADIDGPLFRPLNHNGKRTERRRRMNPDAIDVVLRKYAGTELGLLRDYSAHSLTDRKRNHPYAYPKYQIGD